MKTIPFHSFIRIYLSYFTGFKYHSLYNAAVFGTSAAMFLLRDINVGVFVATSGPGVSVIGLSELTVIPLAFFLMDSVLGIEPFYSESNICTYPFYRDPRNDLKHDFERKDKKQFEKLKVSDFPDLTHNLIEGDVEEDTNTTIRPSIAIVYATLGNYFHPLYGVIHIILGDLYILWVQSENSYGFIGFVNFDGSEFSTHFLWIVPYEFSITYYIPNVAFSDIGANGFEKLQISDAVYERLDGPPTVLEDVIGEKAAVKIKTTKFDNTSKGWQKNLIPIRSPYKIGVKV